MDDTLSLTFNTWYSDSTLAFITDYNKMISEIEDGIVVYGNTVTDTIVALNFVVDSTSANKYFTSGAYEDSIKYTIVKDTGDTQKIINGLRYPINISKDWKEKLKTKNGYFTRKEIKNSSIKSDSITKLVKNLNNLNKYDYFEIDCSSLDIKNENDKWIFKTNTCFKNKEQQAVLEYILNYYIKEVEEFTWFSNSSKKVKNNLKNSNISDNIQDLKDLF